MNVAIFVPVSANSKIGMAAATYASTHATCPKCPLKGHGCYAEQGRVGLTVRRLNDAAEGVSRLNAAKVEAQAIDTGACVPGLPLRLHVSGDSATTQAVRILSAAAERYMARGGGQPWSYTHAWRKVHRESWGKVSVLASIERPRDALRVIARGYAPALIVAKHASAEAYVKDGVKWIPCPAQTLKRTCTDCRLCLDADALRRRTAGIAFEPDYMTSKRVLSVLQ